MSTVVSDPNLQPTSASPHAQASEHDGHIVQLYTNDRFLVDVLSRFVGGALAVGDGAVVVATASHRQALAKLRGAYLWFPILQTTYLYSKNKESSRRMMV